MVLPENAEELPLVDMRNQSPLGRRWSEGRKKMERGGQIRPGRNTHLRLHHVGVERREALETLI